MEQHKRLLSVLSLAVALAILAGCEKEVPRTDYFPLRDGNRWEYRLLDRPLLKRMEAGQTVTTAAIDDDIKPPAPDDPDSQIAPKADVIDPDGSGRDAKSEKPLIARRVALELRGAVDDVTFKALYDTAEQVWSKKSGYVGFQGQHGRSYLLILPPHTGYKWIVTGPGGKDLYYEIEAANANVTTPKGPFHDCVIARQESRDRKEIFKYWFAPNVGLVRRSKYFANQEVFRQELVDYVVKPAMPATRLAEEHEVRKAMAGNHRGTEFRDEHKREGESKLDVETNNKEPDEKVEKYADPK
jgi:hypothetical protein